MIRYGWAVRVLVGGLLEGVTGRIGVAEVPHAHTGSGSRSAFQSIPTLLTGTEEPEPDSAYLLGENAPV